MSRPRAASSPRGRAVARTFEEQGWRLGADRVTLTASTSEAYSFLIKLLCEPGESVLAPSPSYPLLDYLAGLEGVECRRFALDPDDAWSVDADAVLSRHRRSHACGLHRASEQPDRHGAEEPGERPPRGDLRGARARAGERRGLRGLPDRGAARGPAHAGRRQGMPDLLPRGTFQVLCPSTAEARLDRRPAARKRRSARRSAGSRSSRTASSPSLRPCNSPPARSWPADPSFKRRSSPGFTPISRPWKACSAPTRPSHAAAWTAGGAPSCAFPRSEDDEGRAVRWLDERGVLVHPGNLFGFSGTGRYVISLLAMPAAFAEGVAGILTGY